MKSIQNGPKGHKGFTLIELSIVLVIIGLIVGGVLVGQDLIKAAEIRATVAQVEKYNAAVNTFRTKYNGIPGDLADGTAAAFGLYSAMDGTDGQGDGDGLVEGDAAAQVNLGESLAFWRHLSDTTLVEGAFGGALTAAGAVAADTTAATVGSYLPPGKVGRGNYFNANSDSGVNYYVLMGTTVITTAAGATTYVNALTPVESYNVDTKLDDGAPNTGIVIARGTTAPFSALASTQATYSAGAPAAGTCMTTGGDVTSPTNTYNRGASTGGNSPGCGLRLRCN